MKTYTSRLSELFNNEQEKEELFRTNCKQIYAARELAYIMRYFRGENYLRKEVSESNIKLIIDLHYKRYENKNS